MKSIRLPRFKRATAVAAMQLTERDREIIRLVYRHRFLRSSHISSLIRKSKQHLLRRLKLLYHHGFLERPRSQLDYYHQGGSRHIVYGLGNQSVVLLQSELGPVFQELPWGEKNVSIGRMYLQHELFVSDIMVAFELACREAGIRLLTEVDLAVNSAQHRLRWTVKVNNHHKLSVIPDRVFGVDFKNDRGENNRALFFLEADRATMPVIRENLSQTSFYRKLIAYEASWSQSILRTHFGSNRFRVLTVTTSTPRVKSLIDACSKLKRGQGLFLFADRTILENPIQIFSAVWKTGRQGEITGLLN
jgi:DNA-binding Lrp family transcriptional regulator